MSDEQPVTIELTISAATRERISFLAREWAVSEREAAEKLLTDQAEAEAALIRGPWLRKHMYR